MFLTRAEDSIFSQTTYEGMLFLNDRLDTTSADTVSAFFADITVDVAQVTG